MGSEIIHATVVTQPSDRRINSAIGVRRNLCGASPALADLLVKDFTPLLDLPDWRGRLCLQCLDCTVGVLRAGAEQDRRVSELTAAARTEPPKTTK